MLFYAAFSSAVFTQTIDPTQRIFVDAKHAAAIGQAQTMVDSFMRAHNIPGLAVCFATHEKMIWAQGFGLADIEQNVPVTLQSQFRVGSISKTLTSLAVGKLLEQKKLRITDTIGALVPSFPRKRYPITIHQLASHTAGIRDYNFRAGEFLSRTRYGSVNDALAIFKNDSLLFKPGTQYQYTTYGYVLLSAGIEGAAGMDYLTYMHDSVLVPLGMKNTRADKNESIIPGRVRFYDVSDASNVNAYYVDNSNKWAGGGYLSTPLDLARMSQQLLQYRFLREETLRLLWKPFVLENGERTSYGIGWKTGRDSRGREYVFHSGSSIGGRAFLLLYPDEGWIATLACNVTAGFDEQFILGILDFFR